MLTELYPYTTLDYPIIASDQFNVYHFKATFFNLCSALSLVSFYFVDFVSFRFVFVDFVSFLFRFALYRYPTVCHNIDL
jgi:hypothetical protein